MLTAENRMQEAYELSSATNTFPKFVGEFARKTGCVKAIALSKKVLSRSPSVRWKNILRKPPLKKAG